MYFLHSEENPPTPSSRPVLRLVLDGCFAGIAEVACAGALASDTPVLALERDLDGGDVATSHITE